MDKKLEKLLDLLINGIEKGGELASTEIPKIMEEIITFGFWTEIWGLVLSLLIILLTIIPTVILLFKGVRDDDTEKFLLGTVVGIGLSLACICAYNTGYRVLKIKLAPKIYMIEYVRGLK